MNRSHNRRLAETHSASENADVVCMDRRAFCKSVALGAVAIGLAPAAGATGSGRLCSTVTAASAFASSFIDVPESYGPTRVNFDKPLPEGLLGTLFRNGPARMQLGPTRQQHWFDGDGMVHAFKLADKTLVHHARLVETRRSAIENEAGRYLWGGFGTGLADSRSVLSPDDLNAANISVLPLEHEVLALWEAGSPYRIHAETLETLGRHVFSPETDGMPFSAHPRFDPTGAIWNFGYLSGTGKLALYELNARGVMQRASVVDVPNADMVHDFVITEDYLVFVLVPLRFNADGDPGRSFLDNLEWDAAAANEIVVIDKQNLGIVDRFQLPAFFAFHMGNAWQDRDTIHLEIATTPAFDPLMDEIIAATRGELYTGPGISTETADIRLDRTTGHASIQALPTHGADFPRFDQRFTGRRTDRLFMLAAGNNMPSGLFGFNTVTSFDRRNSSETVFDYGADTVSYTHLTLPTICSV